MHSSTQQASGLSIVEAFTPAKLLFAISTALRETRALELRRPRTEKERIGDFVTNLRRHWGGAPLSRSAAQVRDALCVSALWLSVGRPPSNPPGLELNMYGMAWRYLEASVKSILPEIVKLADEAAEEAEPSDVFLTTSMKLRIGTVEQRTVELQQINSEANRILASLQQIAETIDG